MIRMGDHRAVQHQLERLIPTLSPQLRQAARYVLDRPEDVALQSMRRLAGDAGVTPATMVRLAQALGYDGYEPFRQPFQDRLRDPVRSYSDRARQLISARDGDDTHPGVALALRQLDIDIENLSRSYQTIGPERLMACAEVLGAAEALHVIGLRSCYATAFLFHYSVRLFRTGVYLIDGHAGTVSDAVRDVSAGSAVLAISFQPYTRETLTVAEAAVARGARLVTITDSASSPLATISDETLVVETRTESFLHSMLSATSVVQALVSMLLLRGGETALELLAESEAQLTAFSAYVESPPSRYMAGYRSGRRAAAGAVARRKGKTSA